LLLVFLIGLFFDAVVHVEVGVAVPCCCYRCRW